MSEQLDTLLEEGRTFAPPPDFKRHALVKSKTPYRDAERRLSYWARHARQLDWFKPWKRVLEWKCLWAKWFIGGKINASIIVWTATSKG